MRPSAVTALVLVLVFGFVPAACGGSSAYPLHPEHADIPIFPPAEASATPEPSSSACASCTTPPAASSAAQSATAPQGAEPTERSAARKRGGTSPKVKK